MAFKFRNRPGFTFVEISVVLFITAILFSIVLANYRRANQDSLLQRETSLLMSRIRLTQELSAAGHVTKYCAHYTGRKCDAHSDCSLETRYKCCPTQDTSNSGGESIEGTCSDTDTGLPAGGYALAFSCQTTSFNTDDYRYYSFERGNSGYGLFADRKKCFVSNNWCFPTFFQGFEDNVPQETDGIITSAAFQDSANPPTKLKGDTRVEWYDLDSKITVKDIRITATYPVAGDSNRNGYTCEQYSPWAGKAVSGFTDFGEEFTTNDTLQPTGGDVRKYPIQLGIRFVPPDGRKVMLTDNVSSYPPDVNGKPDRTNPWSVGEIMLAIEDRPNTDCRVVKVTASNVVTQYVDADCNFAT